MQIEAKGFSLNEAVTSRLWSLSGDRRRFSFSCGSLRGGSEAMASKHDESPPWVPALIPLYGGGEKKRRPLNRDAVVIGRARGCDIGLEAPDVSSIHCLISRGPNGFFLRDCESRAGTKLNGEPVKESQLQDEDIVQVGPFTFRVHLPQFPKGSRGTNSRAFLVEHLIRSRKNLAQLALRLRNRISEFQGMFAGDKAAHASDGGLHRQASGLRDQFRTYVKRLEQLEQAERELSKDRANLASERKAHEARLKEADDERALLRAQAEAEIQARWREFQERCQQQDTKRGAGAEADTRTDKETSSQVAEQEHRLQIRGNELRLYAGHLARQKELLDKQQQQLTWGFEQMQHEHKQNRQKLAELAADQTQAQSRLDQERDALLKAEAALRDQRAELAQMMADLKQMQEFFRSQQTPDVQALSQENEKLRRLLAERERELQQAKDLQRSDEPPSPSELEKLRNEVERLGQQLRDKDGLIERLRRNGSTDADKRIADVESYETELNQFRQQLQAERDKLTEEIQQLRARNTELDQATREMEMEMSRERAELARERTRLERLREEVRGESERLQRDAGMRQSLAPVQKLRDDTYRKASINSPTPPPPAKEDVLNDRLQAFRNRHNDTVHD
jgi:chromosome segregation ATPase